MLNYILTGKREKIVKSSIAWDKQASSYQKLFKSSWKSEYNEKLMNFLTEELGIKAGDRVIDIGCGVGKYGTYFASMGCDVTLTDISSKMLRHARENMAGFNTPAAFCQCDFDETDITESLFNPRFKLSMSTMSPAVHDASTVKKLSAITEGWCFISRFVSWRQDIRDGYYRLSGTEPARRMDSDHLQDDVNGMLEIIEASGYTPKLRLEDYNWTDLRTPQEAARCFAGADAGEEELQKALEVVKKLCNKDGLFEDTVNTEMAWIYWQP